MSSVTQRSDISPTDLFFLWDAERETAIEAQKLNNRYKSHLKMRNIAIASFCLSSAAIMIRNYFPSIRLIVAGAGIIGMLASSVYAAYQHHRARLIYPWKKSFNHIARRDALTGLRFFDQTLREPYSGWNFETITQHIFEHSLPAYKLFKRIPIDIIGIDIDSSLLPVFLTHLLVCGALLPLQLEPRDTAEKVFSNLQVHMAWGYVTATSIRGGCPETLKRILKNFKSFDSAVNFARDAAEGVHRIKENRIKSLAR